MSRYLFVCVENSCRSQMAEAFARMRGGVAHSAGSAPSGIVHEGAIASMAELGYDLGAHRSKSLRDLGDSDRVDVVVTMGCGDSCSNVDAGRRLDWDIPDPKHMDARGFREVRDLIGRKVEELLRE